MLKYVEKIEIYNRTDLLLWTYVFHINFWLDEKGISYSKSEINDIIIKYLKESYRINLIPFEV